MIFLIFQYSFSCKFCRDKYIGYSVPGMSAAANKVEIPVPAMPVMGTEITHLQKVMGKTPEDGSP